MRGRIQTVAFGVLLAAAGVVLAVFPVHSSAELDRPIAGLEVAGGAVDCGPPVIAAFAPTARRTYEGGTAEFHELTDELQRKACPGPARLRLGGGVALLAAGVGVVVASRPARSHAGRSRAAR